MNKPQVDQNVAAGFGVAGAPAMPPRRQLPDQAAFTRTCASDVSVERKRTGSADAAFALLVALAFRARGTRTGDDTPPTRCNTGSGLAPWQLRRVRTFVDANLDADLFVSDLAAACNLSPSHFSRAFSASMDIPPHKWLVSRRIERAKTLLLGTGDQLAHIALTCGFVDQSHFTRVFARSEGESPGRWRRRRRHLRPNTTRQTPAPSGARPRQTSNAGDDKSPPTPGSFRPSSTS